MAPDLHDEFAALDRPSGGLSEPTLSVARWPNAAPFALFLSHDIDQIYDRELFRLLADINHVRRRFSSEETGNAPLYLVPLQPPPLLAVFLLLQFQKIQFMMLLSPPSNEPHGSRRSYFSFCT